MVVLKASHRFVLYQYRFFVFLFTSSLLRLFQLQLHELLVDKLNDERLNRIRDDARRLFGRLVAGQQIPVYHLLDQLLRVVHLTEINIHLSRPRQNGVINN